MKIPNFRICIDTITEKDIVFTLMIDEIVNKSIVIPHAYFSSLAIGIGAYVYTTRTLFSDEQLKSLWELKVNIFDNKDKKTAKTIFQSDSILKQLYNLQLIK